MEVKYLDQVLTPASHRVDPAVLIGRRLEVVELADLITAAATVRPMDGVPTPVTPFVVHREEVSDGSEFI